MLAQPEGNHQSGDNCRALVASAVIALPAIVSLLGRAWPRPLKRNKIVKKVSFIPSSISFPCGRT